MTNKHIYKSISKIIMPYFKNYEEFFLLLVENWYSIVPTNWHEKVFPSKLKWLSNNKAVLILKKNSNTSTSIIHLSFESQIVIKQINSFFGREVITKIIFK